MTHQRILVGLGSLIVAIGVARWSWTGTVLAAIPAVPSTQPATHPSSGLIRVLDLAGEVHLIGDGTSPAAVVFLGTQCPISARYIADLNVSAASASKRGVPLYGVISSPDVTREQANAFVREYSVKFPILFDASGELARRLKPSTTPDAFVLDRAGAVVYDGRIDDRYPTLGKRRENLTTHELDNAIAAVSKGIAPTVTHMPPVGCAFEAWNNRPADAAVTFTRDVAPTLYASCVECHRPGQAGPFPLIAYNDAKQHAEQMAIVTGTRYMPPWKPSSQSLRIAHDRSLSDAQIAIIKQWADAGAPEGPANELPPAPKFADGWTLGVPDLVVEMPDSFDVPADGRDVNRAFVVPLGLPKDMYLAGFEFKAGSPTVVHHCLLYLDNTGAARKLDERDALPGYRSFGGPGFSPVAAIGGWAPGARSELLGPGVGKLMPANSDLVFQMHYHPDGKPHQDRSKVAFYFQKTPVTQFVGSVPIVARYLDIPAGDSDFTTSVVVTAPIDLLVTGITPHMHTVGRQAKATATYPDGRTEQLIQIQDWDFRWQGQYRFAQPVTLPKGTKVTVTWQYDNSDANPVNPNTPPKRVTWGEQTTDEMALCYLELQSADPTIFRSVRRSFGAEMLRPTGVLGRLLTPKAKP